MNKWGLNNLTNIWLNIEHSVTLLVHWKRFKDSRIPKPFKDCTAVNLPAGGDTDPCQITVTIICSHYNQHLWWLGQPMRRQHVGPAGNNSRLLLKRHLSWWMVREVLDCSHSCEHHYTQHLSERKQARRPNCTKKQLNTEAHSIAAAAAAATGCQSSKAFSLSG